MDELDACREQLAQANARIVRLKRRVYDLKRSRDLWRLRALDWSAKARTRR